jgi:hypothetical protein
MVSLAEAMKAKRVRGKRGGKEKMYMMQQSM